MTNTAARAELFLNVAEKKGNWLMVRAIEPACGGRDAYERHHAQVLRKSAARTVRACSSYCSSHDPPVHFRARSDRQQIDAIEVRWPNGDRETFPGCSVNQLVTLKHGEGGGHEPQENAPEENDQ